MAMLLKHNYSEKSIDTPEQKSLIYALNVHTYKQHTIRPEILMLSNKSSVQYNS